MYRASEDTILHMMYIFKIDYKLGANIVINATEESQSCDYQH